MRTFLWVVLILNQLLLVLLASLNLEKYHLSEFAIRQRLSAIDSQTARLYRQLYKNLSSVRLFWQVKLVASAALSIALWTHLQRPVIGFLLAILLLFLTKILSRYTLLQSLVAKLFESGLKTVILLTNKLQIVWNILGANKTASQFQIYSKDEFIDQLQRLPSTVLDPKQRQRLEMVLNAETHKVKDVMTSKKRVIGIEPSATLGPVVLSDLQKTGHGYFPVMTKKGQPIGILNLNDVSDIQNAKHRSSVKEIMNEQVAWIDESIGIYESIQLFIKEKQYIMLVKDSEEQFSGLITIADVMKHTLNIVQED